MMLIKWHVSSLEPTVERKTPSLQQCRSATGEISTLTYSGPPQPINGLRPGGLSSAITAHSGGWTSLHLLCTMVFSTLDILVKLTVCDTVSWPLYSNICPTWYSIGIATEFGPAAVHTAQQVCRTFYTVCHHLQPKTADSRVCLWMQAFKIT